MQMAFHLPRQLATTNEDAHLHVHRECILGEIGTGKEGPLSIGTVTNLAARLCGEAEHGQVIVSRKLLTAVDEHFSSEALGEFSLKGFKRSITAYNVKDKH